MSLGSLLQKFRTHQKKNIPHANTVASPRFSILLKEGKWLGLIALTAYASIALLSYSPSDAAWSHSTDEAVIRNYAGTSGAWLSDTLFYLFGYSAWVLIGFLLLTILFNCKQILRKQLKLETMPTHYAERTIGATLCLIASTGIEALFVTPHNQFLPLQGGGLLSLLLYNSVTYTIGHTGIVLLLVTLSILGLSLLFHCHWLTIFEKIGWVLEKIALSSWQLVNKKWQAAIHIHQTAHQSVPRTESATIAIPSMPAAIKKKQRPKPTQFVSPGQGSLFANMGYGNLPGLILLESVTSQNLSVSEETIRVTSRLIEEKLAHFGIATRVIQAYPGPVITRYEIEPAVGIKGAQIVNLAKDLARALSLGSIRVVETIPGKTCMGLELPNPQRQIVRLSEIIGSELYQHSDTPLTLAMGKDIAGMPVVANLSKMPHLLVAGTTGSGKSVAINAMVLSLLFKATSSDVRMIMIDPKMLELSVYEGIPHLLAPVVTDMHQATNALNWCVGEMDRRYKLMSQLGVRNLTSFNQKILEAQQAGQTLPNPFSTNLEAPEPLKNMPFIVVVVDELADLMMVVGKKIEGLIARLAQKARAAGIHLILATQRPSVDVITGLIKANIPTRVAFQVSSKIDSRTILDQMGAESLLGQGDMLYLPPGTGYPQRIHGAFVADEEVYRVVEFLKTYGAPDYVANILEHSTNSSEHDVAVITAADNMEDSALYDQAVAVVLRTRRATISSIQRHLRIGYNRAARLIEQMEVAGLVSPMESSGNRTVLVPPTDE
ncbi:MAG: DNA translocase FtsK 4TM domain-containing protein [Neisseriales bacterium]|nr:MAG: DNA translocase FtsK 4TM domain-containing protein [Neisseriales bacterium]